ncbi:GNAT family N-acetyltransferase [Pleionea sp. CnH1-48]|uniref:GNAT family N-acetyltransferase n=1 Tax=Pleionea sp. CnH1-48 TaxID=2954494 RepID=UPI0020975159|nr:GNAT family N-acetyltransferase [Pleionea sp. CnH1-48]MCO7224536.1 GNAT family N-acetyltransferase [Pleionea sp. CnH1-48]
MSELKIDWQWKSFEQLSGLEVAQIMQLRQDVFILEQKCFYPDIDGHDQEALHLMGWVDQTLVATLRLFPSYEAYEGRCSVGRVCTHAEYRRFGLGRQLMSEAMNYLDEHYPEQQTQIGAQTYLERFYESFGFTQCSEPYDDEGIEHILMLRDARSSQ